MTDQTEKSIPQPKNTDNIFLKITFSDMTEEKKTEAITALLDPERDFKSATYQERLQQLDYAKGYINGATQCTEEEATEFIRGSQNIFFKLIRSNRSDEQKQALMQDYLEKPQGRPGSDIQEAYELRLRHYQFLLGYVEGKQTLEKALKNGFNTAAGNDNRAEKQPEPEPLPSEKAPRVTSFVDALKM